MRPGKVFHGAFTQRRWRGTLRSSGRPGIEEAESKGSSTGEEIHRAMESIHRMVMLKTVNLAYWPMNFFTEFNIGSFCGENEMLTVDQDYAAENWTYLVSRRKFT